MESMESFGRTSVTFVDRNTAEFERVELFDNGVIKALRLGPSPSSGVQLPGYTTYKVEFYSPSAWLGLYPSSPVTIPDDPRPTGRAAGQPVSLRPADLSQP